METVSMNIIENNINKLNYTNAMVIEFYDSFGWETDRTITKIGDNLYQLTYFGVNGMPFFRKFDKEKLMEAVKANKVFNSYITSK